MKNIIFDFDGVILDSVPVKTEAFIKLFKGYDKSYINKLVHYHELNGGKSRYIKIKYFFEELLNTKISDSDVLKYAHSYSKLTKIELSKQKYLITETINFIRKHYKEYNMHIASGADENDLKYICKALNLDKYFLSISGSPKIKSEIVKEILNINNYKLNETILIGDSINDFEAANFNGIDFYGFNNELLKDNHKYIHTFLDFK